MTMHGELQTRLEQLLAMILELGTNRIILDGLVSRYGVFLFTGGVVRREPWGLAALGSYLQRPFAADQHLHHCRRPLSACGRGCDESGSGDHSGRAANAALSAGDRRPVRAGIG